MAEKKQRLVPSRNFGVFCLFQKRASLSCGVVFLIRFVFSSSVSSNIRKDLTNVFFFSNRKDSIVGTGKISLSSQVFFFFLSQICLVKWENSNPSFKWSGVVRLITSLICFVFFLFRIEMSTHSIRTTVRSKNHSDTHTNTPTDAHTR